MQPLRLRPRDGGSVAETRSSKWNEHSRDPHFRHISEVTLANKVVEGKTVRQSLADILHGLSKGQRVGSTTYTKLAEKYGDGESKVASIKVTNPDEPVEEELLKLLTGLQADAGLSKASKSLQLYLQSCAELSQRNLVGLVKTVLSPKLEARPDAEMRTLAVMSYCARCAGQ